MNFSGLVDSAHPCRRLLDEADQILSQLFEIRVQRGQPVMCCHPSRTIFKALRCLDDALKVLPDDASLLAAKGAVLFYCDPSDEAKTYFKKAVSQGNSLEARMSLEHWSSWQNFLGFPRWDEDCDELHPAMSLLAFRYNNSIQVVRDGLQKAIALIVAVDELLSDVTRSEIRFVLSLTPYGPIVANYVRLTTTEVAPPTISERVIAIQNPAIQNQRAPLAREGYQLVKQIAEQNYCFVVVLSSGKVSFNRRRLFGERVRAELRQIIDRIESIGSGLTVGNIRDAFKWHADHVPDMDRVFEDLPTVLSD